MKTPSTRVAANRRRALLWLPLLVAGAVVSLAAGPMLTGFNSLDAAGLVFMAAGLAGFVREADL